MKKCLEYAERIYAAGARKMLRHICRKRTCAAYMLRSGPTRIFGHAGAARTQRRHGCNQHHPGNTPIGPHATPGRDSVPNHGPQTHHPTAPLAPRPPRPKPHLTAPATPPPHAPGPNPRFVQRWPRPNHPASPKYPAPNTPDTTSGRPVRPLSALGHDFWALERFSMAPLLHKTPPAPPQTRRPPLHSTPTPARSNDPRAARAIRNHHRP